MYRAKWVANRHEFQPVEIENCVHGDLDVIVATCIKKLPAMRIKHPENPPDGFVIVDDHDHEKRRWFPAS